jgi:hypothetical protein
MLLIVGGLIIAVGMVMIAWDLLVLIGLTVAFIVTASVTAVLGVIVLFQKLIALFQRLEEWDKGRFEQRWEPTQTEVYGDRYAETLEMSVEETLELSVEEAARFAAYVAHFGGNVTVKVVDEPAMPAPAMKDVTPRVPRWLIR